MGLWFFDNKNNSDEVAEIKDSIKQLNDTQNKSNVTLIDLEHNNEVANNNINTMKEMVDKINSDISAGKDINNTILQKTENAKSASDNLNSIIELAKKSTDDLNNSLANAKNIKNQLDNNTDLPKMREDISNNTKQASTNATDINSIKTEINNITTDINNIHKSVDDNTTNIQANAKTSTDNANSIENINKQLTDLINEFNTAKQEIAELNKKGIKTLWQGSASNVGDMLMLEDSLENYDKFIVSFETFGKRSSVCDLKENKIVINNVNLEDNLDTNVMQMFEVDLAKQSDTSLEITFIKRVNSYGDIATNGMSIVKIEGIKY